MSGRTIAKQAYDRWMAGAAALNRASGAVIFGACYVVIAGALAAGQRLRRAAPEPPTFWRARERPTGGADFFRRMS